MDLGPRYTLRLTSDIWLKIAEEYGRHEVTNSRIRFHGPLDLTKLCSVSREMCKIVRPVLYREVLLLDRPATTCTINRLLVDEYLAQSVHRLHVTVDDSCGDVADWNSLPDALMKMKKLRYLLFLTDELEDGRLGK
jgi:hypothetical protein